MFGAYLGREFKDYEIKNALISNNLKFHSGNSAEDLINIIAIDLSKGMSVGWFQGRSEFGPRALGARSILADPRSPETQKRLNLQTKFRESFRPFAPSILEEDYKAWFDWSSPSPYMLFVADVRPEHRIPIDTTAVASQTCETSVERINQVRSTVPAVTHVDYSARLQTVSIKTNPLYHRLITAFKEITGVPILVNTSFNIRGEPIVDSPEDAIRCFLGTDIDVLFIGDYIVYKKENMDRLRDYRKLYDLD
jgi:carbamoyltransferase